MNGVIYCRVSSKEQMEGTSLGSQEFACREYAREKNIKILKIFIEQGESAKFADRTQLLELIDFCRQNKGQVQILLVWKVDRFSRNVSDHFSIKATLKKYGVSIVSVTEPIDANPEGKLMETILAGFAQFDNDIRAMRTVQGMKRKLQEGIFPWRPPLGYGSPKKTGEKKNAPDEPDQPLFGLLQKVWLEFATGAHTKADIRRLMASWGITTQKGKPISPQSLDNLLGNPYYAGVLVDPWSGEEYEGRHIPAVSRQDFARVQQLIGRRSRSVPHHKDRPEFPLRGLVRCGACLRYMSGSFSQGRSARYPYYHCHNRACGSKGKSYSVKEIHDNFELFLTAVSPKQELLEKLGYAIVQVSEKHHVLEKAKGARREAALLRLKREQQELIRMRMQDLLTDKEFITQKQLLSERRTAIEAGSAYHALSVNEIQDRVAEITAPLTQLLDTWKSMPSLLRRRFEHLVLPAGFANGQIRTADLGLLFRVFRDFQGANSTVGSLTGESSNQILQEIIAFSDLLRAWHSGEDLSEDPVRRISRE